MPQNRERVFIVGHFRGRSGRKVFPIGGSDSEVAESNTTKCLNPKDENEKQPSLNDRAYSADGVSTAATTSPFFMGNVMVKQVGNIVDTGNWGNPQRGRIYSPEGCSPALNCCGGGGLEPKVMVGIDKSCNEPKLKDIANCLTAREDRGISNKKQEGTAVVCIGNVHPSGNGMNGNVFDSNGLAPTLTTNKGEGNKIAIPCLTPDRAEKRQNGRRFKEDGEPMFTLTAQDKHGVAIIDSRIKPGIARNFRREYSEIISSDKEIYQCKCDSGWNDNKVGIKSSPTLRANNPHTSVLDANFRIRKLTPKECFRLQGWPDIYFKRAALVNSNSQLYKQAGNGVSVPVIYEIAKRF